MDSHEGSKVNAWFILLLLVESPDCWESMPVLPKTALLWVMMKNSHCSLLEDSKRRIK